MTTATPTSISIRQLNLAPGSLATICDVTWQAFEDILEELGENRTARLAHGDGTLTIMVPLPEHEKPTQIISDIVKALLDAKERDWEPLGSTTFKRSDMAAGIEPDNCFYIQNYRQVVNKSRIDLTVDPPPDLAIETDVTSQAALAAYQTLGVPELWVYRQSQLRIYRLHNGEYVESEQSGVFPDLSLKPLIAGLVQRALREGVSNTLREFRQTI